MNKDEEYVRSVWAASPVKQEFDEDGPMNLWSIHGWISSTPLFAYESQEAAWSAAAEFTRERMEEVRQLREEIHRLQCLLMPSPETNVREATDEAWPEGAVCEYVRETFAYARTIARLEAELTRLTAGMKPEAL